MITVPVPLEISVPLRFVRAAALTILASVVLGGAPAVAQPRPAAVPYAPEDGVTTTLYAAVEALPVAAESRTGYERSQFRHWTDADKDGCNTRKEVLLEEAVDAPAVGPGCAFTGGTWFSPYDNVTLRDAGALDVDHMVPLAEAWDSGASAWTAKEREAYANDLGDPRSLIAVSAKSNRSKADKDIAEWLPANGYVCQYITDWTTVKTRWGLTADSAEKTTLTRLAATCPDESITVEPARQPGSRRRSAQRR